MGVIKKYVLIKMEVYNRNRSFIVELSQGHETITGIRHDSHNREFYSEDDAISYLDENELYGEWICVPILRRNLWEDNE